MGNLEKNPWAMTPKQERAHGIQHLSRKQEAAHTPHDTAYTKEYDFSGAEGVFGGNDDESENNSGTKH